jgi:hypothetical protein
MARKWSNLNLPGALHYITGNFLDRTPVFTDAECCKILLDELEKLKRNWPSKLITYVLMPDHLHLIADPPGWSNQGIHGPVESGFRQGHRSGKQPLCFCGDGQGPSALARELQRCGVVERVDDLAKDQLHPRQPAEGLLSRISQRLLLARLSVVLLTG